jgi:hypothetical protein
MRTKYKFGLGAVVVGYLVACSPVKFDSKSEPSTSCQGFSQACVSGGGLDNFDYQTSVGGGKVDILFVDDNSASMSFEQNQIATRFTNFIAALDASNVDYRIGIITTDVSTSQASAPFTNGSRTINQNGALQDGRLIQFGNGQYYITQSTSNRVTLFANAIKRQETLTCETYLQSNSSVGQTSTDYLSNCPSPDERGIYAINLFLRSNPSGFIRSTDARHLAIVVLSDEDMRSSVYPDATSFALTSDDLPSSVISTARSLYGNTTLSVHSLIVKPGALNGVTAEQASQALDSAIVSGFNSSNRPSAMFATGDSACLAAQNSQINGVSGSYGYMYALLTRLTGGIEGSVCATDYASQLTSIASNIGQQLNQLQLACTNPQSLSITFITGTPVGYTISGTTLSFSSPLNTGVTIRVQYSCPAQ